jgi:restriction system protein
MVIPTQRLIELPLLYEIAQAGGEAKPADLYQVVRAHFPDITDKDMELTTASGEGTWSNRVQWARMRLVIAGEIDRSVPGIWKITTKGRKRLIEEGYRGAKYIPIPRITLEKLIAEHTDEIRGELKSKIESLTPKQFEFFAEKLLIAFGFRETKVTSYAKDGGVDGYGKLKLGLVTVSAAFQCKKWSHPVQKPDVDRFRGAIAGKYDYGILISTTTFSSGALNASVQPGTVTIQMVDGEMIVDMMMNKGLGVKPQPLIQMALDDEYFILEEV